MGEVRQDSNMSWLKPGWIDEWTPAGAAFSIVFCLLFLEEPKGSFAEEYETAEVSAWTRHPGKS